MGRRTISQGVGRHDKAIFFLQANQTNRKLIGETDLNDPREIRLSIHPIHHPADISSAVSARSYDASSKHFQAYFSSHLGVTALCRQSRRDSSRRWVRWMHRRAQRILIRDWRVTGSSRGKALLVLFSTCAAVSRGREGTEQKEG